MPFREKTAWIAVASMTLIYAIYFWSVWQHRPETRFPYLGLLATVVALVVVQVGLTIVAAIFAPQDAKAPRDEREKLIELKSARFAYAGLATGIALACFFAAFDPPILFNTNALLFILVTAEIMRSASQIIQHRRAA